MTETTICPWLHFLGRGTQHCTIIDMNDNETDGSQTVKRAGRKHLIYRAPGIQQRQYTPINKDLPTHTEGQHLDCHHRQRISRHRIRAGSPRASLPDGFAARLVLTAGRARFAVLGARHV